VAAHPLCARARSARALGWRHGGVPASDQAPSPPPSLGDNKRLRSAAGSPPRMPQVEVLAVLALYAGFIGIQRGRIAYQRKSPALLRGFKVRTASWRRQRDDLPRCQASRPSLALLGPSLRHKMIATLTLRVPRLQGFGPINPYLIGRHHVITCTMPAKIGWQ